MICANYMGQSCGLQCCMCKAEQFAFFEHNEPDFNEFCPMVHRYGEMLGCSQGSKANDQGNHWSTSRWQ